MTKSESFFDHPQINHEYIRWRKKIGADKPPAEIADIALSVGEVLRAHFLIAQFFADEEEGLGGLGPRDKNGDLLHSAVSRQFTGFGDERKWTDNFHIAATVLFGLIKNHPFHDGNKRTALLSVLHLLWKHGYTPSVPQCQLENLVVAISNNRYQQDHLHQYERDKEKIPAEDAEIIYIASCLKNMSGKPVDPIQEMLQLNKEWPNIKFIMRNSLASHGIGFSIRADMTDFCPVGDMKFFILKYADTLRRLAGR